MIINILTVRVVHLFLGQNQTCFTFYVKNYSNHYWANTVVHILKVNMAHFIYHGNNTLYHLMHQDQFFFIKDFHCNLHKKLNGNNFSVGSKWCFCKFGFALNLGYFKHLVFLKNILISSGAYFTVDEQA